MDYKAQLESYAAKYPGTDLFEFVHGQLEKGILIVEDRHGKEGVIAYGDRFSNKREVVVLWNDGRTDFLSIRCLEFRRGTRRKIYWPSGVRVGGFCQRMFQHLDRRWRSGW